MYFKQLSGRDLDIAARTVYGEARGESFQGMKAVAWVLRNRSEIDIWDDGKPDWWGETLSEVCQKKWQFSCWNFNDPNRMKLLALPVTNETYKQCLRAVAEVLVEPQIADATMGAFHYHAIGIHPSWASAAQPSLRMGNHIFYVGVK